MLIFLLIYTKNFVPGLKTTPASPYTISKKMVAWLAVLTNYNEEGTKKHLQPFISESGAQIAENGCALLLEKWVLRLEVSK